MKLLEYDVTEREKFQLVQVSVRQQQADQVLNFRDIKIKTLSLAVEHKSKLFIVCFNIIKISFSLWTLC